MFGIQLDPRLADTSIICMFLTGLVILRLVLLVPARHCRTGAILNGICIRVLKLILLSSQPTQCKAIFSTLSSARA